MEGALHGRLAWKVPCMVGLLGGALHGLCIAWKVYCVASTQASSRRQAWHEGHAAASWQHQAVCCRWAWSQIQALLKRSSYSTADVASVADAVRSCTSHRWNTGCSSEDGRLQAAPLPTRALLSGACV